MHVRGLSVVFWSGVMLVAAAGCGDSDCDCSNTCKQDAAVVNKDTGEPKKDTGEPNKDGPVVNKDTGGNKDGKVNPDLTPIPPVKMPNRLFYASAYDKAGKQTAKWNMYSALTTNGTGVLTYFAISAAAQTPSHFSLSPLGNYVAFNLNKALAVGNLKTKKLKTAVKPYNSLSWAKGWSRDEAKLVVRYLGIRVLEIPGETLFAEQVETAKTNDDRAAISFDNKKLAYVGKDDKGKTTLIIKDSLLKKEEGAGAVGLGSAGWVFPIKSGFIVTSFKGWHTFDDKGKQTATVDLPADPAPVATEAVWPRPNPDGTHVMVMVKPKTPGAPNKPHQLRYYAMDGKSFTKVADTSYGASSDYCLNEAANVVYIMEDGFTPMLYSTDGKKVALPKAQLRYAKCAGLF